MSPLRKLITSLVAPCFVVLILATHATIARAALISAVTLAGGTSGPTGANVSAGYSFVTNEAVTINALADFAPLATGTDVRLYNGLGTVLAEATVTPSDPSDGTFNFAAISPLSLPAASIFYLAADTATGQPGEWSVTGLTTNPAITFSGPVESFGFGNNPTSDLQNGALSPAYFGPSFAIVPEPSAYLTAMIGSAFLLIAGLVRGGFPFVTR